MKQKRIDTSSVVVYIAALVTVLLMVAVGFLYSQNKVYKQLNKELIIQNDSVLSINIELKDALNNMELNTNRKSMVSVKQENN